MGGESEDWLSLDFGWNILVPLYPGQQQPTLGKCFFPMRSLERVVVKHTEPGISSKLETAQCPPSWAKWTKDLCPSFVDIKHCVVSWTRSESWTRTRNKYFTFFDTRHFFHLLEQEANPEQERKYYVFTVEQGAINEHESETSILPSVISDTVHTLLNKGANL